MKIHSAEFILSAASPWQFPVPSLPEIAFAGRSNVGKSTLINSLLNRKKLVKTSSTPGKTQLINFFKINDEFYFVDLPGYGFAKVPKSVKEAWGNTMERYLASKRNKLVFVLLDIRRIPSREDLDMLEWLEYYEVPYKIIFTKVDKMSNNQKFKQLKEIRKKIEFKNNDVLFYSALSHKGRKELCDYLDEAIEEYKDYTPPVIDYDID